MAIMLASYVGMGIVLALVSIPLIRKQIRPNYWYGVRIPQTMNNTEVWYDVNAYVGKRLFAIGILSIVAAVGLYLIPHLALDTYTIACLVVVMVGFIVTAIQTIRHLQALRK
jgi:hypothetical protein